MSNNGDPGSDRPTDSTSSSDGSDDDSTAAGEGNESGASETSPSEEGDSPPTEPSGSEEGTVTDPDTDDTTGTGAGGTTTPQSDDGSAADSDSGWDRTILDTVPTIIASAAVICIVGIVSGIIVLRNAGIGVLGLNSVAQILGVWVIFILAGSLALDRRHIQIAYFTDRIPEPWDRVHNVFVLLVGTFTCLFFLYSAVSRAEASLGQVVPGPDIPVIVYFIPVIIGFGMMTFVYLRDVWNLAGLTDRLSEVSGDD